MSSPTLYGGQTQGADLRDQGRPGTDLATSAPRVYDLDLVGIEGGQPGGGGWR